MLELDRAILAAGGFPREGADVLPELRVLYLDNTQITDAGLAHLGGLTGLYELRFGNTKVTDAGVADIKAALPGREVSH